jgi:hypothetical protein
MVPKHLIKLNSVSPPPKRKAGLGRKRKFNNNDLPKGCTTGGAWHNHFLPTILKYVMMERDAWSIVDSEAVKLKQGTWDYCYGDRIPHDVKVGGAVFCVVSIFCLFYLFC